MTASFVADPVLLASSGERLRRQPRARFLLGGAGAGKSSVARAIAATVPGVAVLDMDERMYGTWSDRWDARRHPVASRWLASDDPLATQLTMEPQTFVAFQAALAVEALDLLAADLEASPQDSRWIVVDGGFGSVRPVAEAVSRAAIACLAAPHGDRSTVWTGDPERRVFLEIVRSVAVVEDPVGRFLALDAALSETMERDAQSFGVTLVRRHDGEPRALTVQRVMDALHIGAADGPCDSGGR